MEEDQELKFVCKLCSKKFPCGKSLGGHMRSHVVANYSAESEERLIESHMKKIASSLGGGGEFGNGQTSYGLRENPRKTWRAADANFTLPLEKTCKQCGKGFQSLKALCGHMASHSERDNKGLKDDHSWSTSENRKLVVDSDQSDTEDEDLVFRTRSSSWTKSGKYNKIVVKPPFSLPINGSSSVSEIDGEEQEELAMCLMLLSRDCGGSYNNHKGGVNSVVESSDNNSVIMETNTSSIDKRVGKMEVFRNENGKKNGDVKLRDCALDVENSDSGYFLDECAKAESDSSVGGYLRNAGFNFSQRCYRAEADKESMARKVFDYEKNVCMGSNPARIVESRKKKYVSEHQNGSEKRTKYECFNCKKTFKSYQALGGHRPCHKRTNAFYESRYESCENSFLDDDSTEVVRRKQPSAKDAIGKKSKGKKNKGGHVCPFCDRVFKNGQALGGHKRSHFIGGHEESNSNNNHNRSPEKKKPDLLDLNLPAPQEDEDDGNERFLADY